MTELAEKVSAAEQNVMALIFFPFDYNETTHPSVVPICIRDTDDDGRLIHRGWFDLGVPPAAERLLRIAYRVLGDRDRVSEITEYAVHSLSRTRGDKLDENPSFRVLERALCRADDLRVGGRRVGRTADVELFDETLETLAEQYDFAAHLMAKDTLDRLVEQLGRMGQERAIEMVPMLLRECEGAELRRRYGKCRNTVTKQFFRKMRLAARIADIEW